MTIFFLFFISKKVQGPEVKKSANRTGSGCEKSPISGYSDLRALVYVSDICTIMTCPAPSKSYSFIMKMMTVKKKQDG